MKALIKWIVFDVGNVLIDIDLETPLDELAKKTGVPREKIKDFFNESGEKIPTHKMYQTGKLSTKEYLLSLSNYLDNKLSIQELCDNIFLVLKEERKQVLDILIKLKADYKVACFSNTTELHWEKLKTYCEYFKYLDIEITSYGLGFAKPNKEAYLKMLEKLVVKPEEVFFIDDSKTNIECASELGINSFQYVDFEGFKKRVNDLI